MPAPGDFHSSEKKRKIDNIMLFDGEIVPSSEQTEYKLRQSKVDKIQLYFKQRESFKKIEEDFFLPLMKYFTSIQHF